MKKIMSDKSFWIILVISIISLIVLTVGVIFLTRKNTKEFYSAGYIINSTATKSDRYYFNENTVYKENVFEEYVFNDVDDNEVSTSKENFIHYLDNSLSFMKNGVILDLDNFNENIVPYYNITDKSIVQYNNGGYYVETADKTLVFGNFLGRITDNKYIVVGNDINVKLAGNDETVKGDYFEILFIEDGIVKVENQEGSYQTISDGSVIYIGDDIKINLGDKSVTYGNEMKLNLTELTIDGNENIDIVPEEGLVNNNEGTDGSGGSGTGSENSTGSGDGTGTGTGDGTGNGEDTGEGNNTDVPGETTTVLKKEVAVNLIEASSTVNSISAKFQVIDTMDAIKGNLVLTLVNTTTGETVYTKMLANVVEEQSVIINSLPSNCNYVMTIVDENNETSTQYFQKSFRTDSLNLRLKREMATETSLTYSLDFGTQSDVVAADVSIFDEEGNELGSYTIEKDSNASVTFENLTNNTLYDVVVDNVVIKNVQYDKLYSSRTSDLTLKNKPTLGDISVKTNDDVKNFTLKMDSVNDEDNAIVKYTYQIFKADDLTEETMSTAIPVYSFVRSELNEEILKLDEAKNLYGNTDYRFKIVAQYYDNYRYNEIETKYSDYFQIVGKPTLSFEASVIDINRIAGTVIFEDADCTIPFEGRECNDAINNFVIRYYGGTTSTRNAIDNVVVDNDNMTLSFDLTGLEENTLYTFEVYADIDLHNDNGLQEGQYIGGFNVSTTGISALMMQNWKKNDYSFDIPISINTEMVSTIPDDDSIDNLSSITFNLYSGDVKSYIEFAEPIASFTVTDDVKDKFYNKEFTIDSSMFEYVDSETSEVFKIDNLDVLKELSGGTLSRYYTIEVTDAFDDTMTNEFAIINNIFVYDTPSILLLEDQVTPPEVVVEEITNIQTKSGEYNETYGIYYISELGDEIVRGYKVTAVFEKNKIESYFPTGNPITKVNFYAHNSNGNLIEEKTIDFANVEEYTAYFFLKDGTDYSVTDTDLRRGNTYTFSYDLSINDDGDPNTQELVFPASRPVSENMTSVKQVPSIKYYVENSTDTAITYKYQVYDYDNALYAEDGKYYIHYSVSDSEEDFTTEFVKDGSNNLFTLSNLSNQSIYSIGYYSAVVKSEKPSKVNVCSYYFDGYYNLNDAIKYELEYSNNSNELKIIIDDNEFSNRVAAYLLTLTAEGVTNKYEKVISNLSTCGEKKCIVVNYTELNTDDIPFKGKNITVSLDAFYDTGYVGFGQESKLGDYFKNLGYVDEDDASKVGFVYQTTGTSGAGKYFYITNSGFVLKGSKVALYDYPRGILGFELSSTDNLNNVWVLNTVNLINDSSKKFAKFGEIAYNNVSVIATNNVEKGIGFVGMPDVDVSGVTINPKVLDVVDVATEDNKFKFTSIIPSVKTQNINSLINGATMEVVLDVDTDTLKTDYIATDGKYKFYIDIYQEAICSETSDDDCVIGETYDKLIKTVETDYDNLSNVSFDGLNPATTYTYKISADMNKNGSKIKTTLFGSNGKEFEEKLTTLTKDKIFNKVRYGHTSSITEETYSNRKLTLTSYLKTKTNFNLKYKLSNADGDVFEVIVPNDSILVGNNITASYEHDVTGNEFVFGPGYHELVITAVPEDLEVENWELELYRGMLTYNTGDYGFKELSAPTFAFTGLTSSSNSINSSIMVTDIDKVINDGTFFVKLQDAAYNNVLVCSEDDENCKLACSTDDKDNNNSCKLTIKIYKESNQIKGLCVDKDKYKNIDTCTVNVLSENNYQVLIKFKDLKPDTNYSLYVYADTYSKNYKNNQFVEPTGLTYVRKNQYTRSELNFSLGAVTPVAVSEKKIDISFVSSSNLSNYLVGIKYTVNIDGGERVKSGTFGITPVEESGADKLIFDGSGAYPTISITTDKELGAANYIIMQYYYKDDEGNIKVLEDANGNTSFQYTVKEKS